LSQSDQTCGCGFDIGDLESDQLLAKLHYVQSKIRKEICIEKQWTQDQKQITHYFTQQFSAAGLA
jgi:hypothetical protein